MTAALRQSLLPIVRRRIWQMALLVGAVVLPAMALLGVQYWREARIESRQAAEIRSLSAAQDAMLAIDDLPGTSPGDRVSTEAQWRAARERVRYRLNQLLATRPEALPEEAAPILERVRTIAGELDAQPAGAPPNERGVLLQETLRASLDQIRRLQEAQLGNERREFDRANRLLALTAGPALFVLLVMAALVGTYLARSMARQSRLDDQIRADLIESEERYRSLFEGNLDAVFSLGPDGRFTTANPSAVRLAGRGLEELRRTHFLEVCAVDQREAAAEAFRAAFCRQCMTLDVAIVSASGERRDLFISGSPTAVAGVVVGVACIARDVTDRKRSEVALRNSELRLRTIFETELECVKLQDADGRIVEINPTGLKLFGAKSVEEARTLDPMERVSPEFREALRADQAAVFRGETRRLVFEFVTPEGARHWMDQHAVPMRDPADSGKVLQMLTVARDITEEREARRRLDEQDALLRKVSAQLPGFIYQYQRFSDGRGCMPYASEGIRGVYGLTPEQVRESAEPIFRLLHPDDLEAVKASVQRSEETMAPWSCEYRVRFPAHAVRWVEGQATPERLGDGSILWHGYIRDITERREAAAAVQRLASVIEASTDFIAYADLDGRLLYVNPTGRALVRLDPGAAIATLKVEDFIGPADQRKMQDEIVGQVQGSGHWRGQFRLRDFGGGEPISVDMNAFLIRDAGGEPIGIGNISRDIRERLKGERMAARTQRLEAIGTLAGGIAHDLNNALAPVLMVLDMLRMQLPEEEPLIDTVRQSCRRAAEMVKQVLTFAKGAHGERELLKPAHLLDEVARIVTSTFPKNIDFRASAGAETPPIVGDATQLHQVLLNLCVNARDAMPNGGTLTMSCAAVRIDEIYAGTAPDARPGRYARFVIEDTGLGIPTEIVDRIFDPFFTTKDPDKGTGLGLSTALGIVRGHGGFMEVFSKPGRGSRFEVHLPLAGADSAVAAVNRESIPMTIGQGETVLLVDDESAILHVATTALERMNFRVICAASGQEALELAAEHQAALRIIITDLHMPKMDGLTFVAAVRALCPKARIVVATGRLDEPAASQFQALGVRSFLHKPFTQEDLALALLPLIRAAQKD